jgi:hypothetical protein
MDAAIRRVTFVSDKWQLASSSRSLQKSEAIGDDAATSSDAMDMVGDCTRAPVGDVPVTTFQRGLLLSCS